MSNLLFISSVRHRRAPRLSEVITGLAKDLERQLGLVLRPNIRRAIVGEVLDFLGRSAEVI